jgi:hypothetical protein
MNVTPEQVQICTKKKRKNCFEVATPNRVYYLVADNESEMKSWMDTIKQTLTVGKQNGNSEAAVRNNYFLMITIR